MMDDSFVVKAPAGQEYHRAYKRGRYYVTPCGRTWHELRVRPVSDRAATCQICCQYRPDVSRMRYTAFTQKAEQWADRIVSGLSRLSARLTATKGSPVIAAPKSERLQLRILLDLDGTILVNAGPKVAEEEFGVDMSGVSDHHGMLARFQQQLGWNESQFWDWWVKRERFIYSRGMVMPHAVETLYQLRQHGAYIHIVTARRDHSSDTTLQWLKRHDVPYDGISFNNHNGKVEAAKRYRLNLAFEDEPKNIEGLRQLMPIIALDAPANREVANGNGVYKVSSWREVPRVLARLGYCAVETA